MPRRTRRVYTVKQQATAVCPVPGCDKVEAASARTTAEAQRRADEYMLGHIDLVHRDRH